MFRPQSVTRTLLVMLILHLGFGLVLKRSRRQAVNVADLDFAGPRFADVAGYQGAAEYGETAGKLGARGLMVPGFGNPLDRISAKRRADTHIVPRRRTSLPLDRIGGSYIPRRSGWSDYPETDWEFYEDELIVPSFDTLQ